MKTIRKNKRGFTLVEMMLSLAIVGIVSGCLFTLVVAIKDSYINTYNSDDSTDYAMLFARGFENSFLANVQDNSYHSATEDVKWAMGVKNGHQVLAMQKGTNTTPVFECRQMTVSRPNGTQADKWLIYMQFSWNDTTKLVGYDIYVVDNYYNPGVVKCKYSGSVYLPHFDNGQIEVYNCALTTHTNGAVYPANNSSYIVFKHA